uniref:Uncharacterized protein n=1 Tax=Arundo donax TaxID=35708 RepID=A0A0A8YC38_ARUDO
MRTCSLCIYLPAHLSSSICANQFTKKKYLVIRV